jgi:DNA-binding winged helix-turn-helix (wHTH) protein
MRLRFSEFVFDAAGRRLTRNGQLVHLERKAFELLELLLERYPAAVSKADIRDRLWPATFVGDSSLTTLAAQLRRALGRRLVRTLYGYGYAFETTTVVDPAAKVAHRDARRPCLLWQGVAFPLRPGENLLGRSEDAHVPISAPGVSRRHALLRTDEAQATIEDAGSRNGTFVNHCPVKEPVTLKDRDVLGIGAARLRFRLIEPEARTVDSSELCGGLG